MIVKYKEQLERNVELRKAVFFRWRYFSTFDVEGNDSVEKKNLVSPPGKWERIAETMPLSKWGVDPIPRQSQPCNQREGRTSESKWKIWGGEGLMVEGGSSLFLLYFPPWNESKSLTEKWWMLDVRGGKKRYKFIALVTWLGKCSRITELVQDACPLEICG